MGLLDRQVAVIESIASRFMRIDKTIKLVVCLSRAAAREWALLPHICLPVTEGLAKPDPCADSGLWKYVLYTRPGFEVSTALADLE